MTGTHLQIDHNTGSIADAFNQLLAKTNDGSEAFAAIASHLELSTRGRFDTETAPDGSTWKEHKESTTKAREKQDLRVDKVLHGETLNLRDLIHTDYGPDSVWISTGQHASAYAAKQQFGADNLQVNVGAHQRKMTHVFGRELANPITANVNAFSYTLNQEARPFLGISSEDEDAILGILGDFLMQFD